MIMDVKCSTTRECGYKIGRGLTSCLNPSQCAFQSERGYVTEGELDTLKVLQETKHSLAQFKGTNRNFKEYLHCLRGSHA